MADREPTLAKAEVNYQNGDEKEHCGNCVMFRGKADDWSGTCDLVKGQIVFYKVCDRWEAKPK